MHYLITGHTGFKGSWLTLLLKAQGHKVSGISLEPVDISLFNQLKISSQLENDERLDIRNLKELKDKIRLINPEVIVHLAAQPLVRASYQKPLETFEVNVLGTLNVLEASIDAQDLKSTLIITTDKVYKNRGHSRPYLETDEIGGDDPYSASKAAADIAAQSWIKNFASSPISIARAGNVIGGGDWAQDRLIPDLVNSFKNDELPKLRYPNAIRPWQHVLDCLSGYLQLVEKSIKSDLLDFGQWNFGPNPNTRISVATLTSEFSKIWNQRHVKKSWEYQNVDEPEESDFLLLDSTKSQKLLGWREKLDFEKTLEWTARWYQAFLNGDVIKETEKQISDYINL